MTLEEIETLLDEKLVAKTYGEIAFVDNVPEISKLILASHLRSQIELLEQNIERLRKLQMRFLSDSVTDKYTWNGLNLAYLELNIHKSSLSEQLTKLNQ